MDVTSISDPPDYEKLTVAERVGYIELLLERLFAHEDDALIPRQHQQIVLERIASYRRDESAWRPASKVFAELRVDSK